MKQPCVYILASKPYGTLYIGVTSNLLARIHRHKAGLEHGFTAHHNVKHLVYFEMHTTMQDAIWREKSIKRWRRDWKISLIEQQNPHWCDLFQQLSL